MPFCIAESLWIWLCLVYVLFLQTQRGRTKKPWRNYIMVSGELTLALLSKSAQGAEGNAC